MRSIKNKAVSLALVGGLAVFGAACEAETDVDAPGQTEVPAEDTDTDTGGDLGDTSTEAPVEGDTEADTED